jgi:hypothetical protein
LEELIDVWVPGGTEMVEFSLKYNVVLSIMEQEYQKYKRYTEFIPFYRNVESEGVELYAG